MADDHAAKAISAYGMAINSTLNIDRIAEEGMRLDHSCVTNSICTPSRAAILTGTYNHVNCVTTLKTHLDTVCRMLPSIFSPVDIKQQSLAKGTLVKARITNQPDLTSGLLFPDRVNISIQQ